MGKIYETVVFKSLDTKQRRTVTPERQETNEVIPSIVHPTALRVSRLQNKEGNSWRAQRTLGVEGVKLKVQGD